MNSKTSFFNKSIFKTDIKRYWWTSLLETFIIYITSVVPLYNRCVNFDEYNMMGYSYGGFTPDWIYFGGILILIAFAVGIPVMLFSYMHFSASMSTHHSLPIKRSQLLLTKTITGIVLTITPVLLNGIMLGIMTSQPEYRELIGLIPIVEWCIAGMLYTVVIFALTTAVNMMTGHPVGTLIFTAGFAALPSIIMVFLEGFFDIEYFGYSGSNMVQILNYIYADTQRLVTFPTYLVYIIMAVVLFTGAYFLYKYRKLENHGEVIAFSWLKPVFIGIVAMLASMFSWAYFNGVLAIKGVFWMIPLGVVGTVIAWMISRKSLSLRGVHKPILIYVAVALIAGMAVHFDVTGYETRVPDAGSVSSVRLGYGKAYIRTKHIDDMEVQYKLIGGVDTGFTDRGDIEKITELHKAITDDRKNPEGGYYTPIEYILKNGKVITRHYHIDEVKYADYLKPIYETPQMRAVNYGLADGTEKEIVHLNIQDRRTVTDEKDTIYPDNPYMDKLITALKKDIENLTYEDMTINKWASVSIGVAYEHIVDYVDTPEVENTKIDNQEYEEYYINKSFVNTIAVLEDMGFYGRIPEAKDIERIEIRTWKGSDHPNSDKEYSVIETVTDKQEIANIYGVYDSMVEGVKYTDIEKADNILICFTLKSGHFFEISCSYDNDKIPEVLKPYFE